MEVGSLGVHMPESEPSPLLHVIHKNQLKMERMTKVRAKTVTLPEDKIGENLCDLGFGSEYLGTSPNSWSMICKKWHKIIKL